jgi:hypothetical protein
MAWSNIEDQRAYVQRKIAADPKYYQKKYQRVKESINGSRLNYAANKISKQKSAAQRRGIEWSLNESQLFKRFQTTDHCAISGREFVFEIGHPDSPSIDRKNSFLGYTARNIQLVTLAANRAKNVLSDREFVQLCKDIAQHHFGKTRRVKGPTKRARSATR